MTSPELVVLAAGMGSRYGGLKQLDPVGPGGETILDYSLYDAQRAGFGSVTLVVRREMRDALERSLIARWRSRLEVRCVFQELERLPAGFAVPYGRTKPWGTAQAVLAAADAVRGPFGVINADDFYGEESYRLLSGHLRADSCNDAMVGFILRNTLSEFGPVARGVCKVSADDFLESVEELTQIERDATGAIGSSDARSRRLTGDEVVSMNMWGFRPTVFDRLRDYFVKFLEQDGADTKAECYMPSAVNEWISAGQERVKVLRSAGAWLGMTYREDRRRVAEHLARLVPEGRYPERLWS